MTVLIFLMALAIGLAEGMPLRKNSRKKEFNVMSILLGSACLLALANVFGLSSPISLLQKYIEPIGKMIFK